MSVWDKAEKFITDHVDMIDLDNWDEFYNALSLSFYSQDVIVKVNQMLLEAGIDILSHIDNVPCYLYQWDRDIEVMHLPNHIKKIEAGAFRGCYKLRDINLANIESVENHAFEDCFELSNIGDMKNLESIGNQAFSMCQKLPKLYFSKNLKYICTESFAYCDDIEIIFDGTKEDWKRNQEKIVFVC